MWTERHSYLLAVSHDRETITCSHGNSWGHWRVAKVAAWSGVDSLVVRQRWIWDWFPGLTIVDWEARNKNRRQDWSTFYTAVMVRINADIFSFVLVPKFTCFDCLKSIISSTTVQML